VNWEPDFVRSIPVGSCSVGRPWKRTRYISADLCTYRPENQYQSLASFEIQTDSLLSETSLSYLEMAIVLSVAD
jgi:hypothetical protein